MKIKTGFVLEEVGGSYLACATGALASGFSGLVRLNETGAFLWGLLSDKDMTREGLLSAMTAEYDVSEEIALGDIDAFIAKLRANGILDE